MFGRSILKWLLVSCYAFIMTLYLMIKKVPQKSDFDAYVVYWASVGLSYMMAFMANF